MLLELGGLLTIGAWGYILLARRAEWRSDAIGNPTNTYPAVTAIIPARDEEATVAAAIGSLARQNYPGEFHIILVDDDSHDRTADFARAAAPPSRLTVVGAAPVPPGWTGKLWALAEGVRHAAHFQPEYLLFTDADIVHPPDNLACLVRRAQAGRYALVSYMATLRCRSFAERALVPAFVYFFFLLYPPRWIRDPRRQTAGAAGGCILLRHAALEKIGGLEAIRGELIDDCALAGAVKRHGGQVWLGVSPETLSLRDYRSLGEIGRMISRTAFTQLRYSALLLMGTLLAMAFVFFLPPALALAAAQPARSLGALAWLLMSLAYLPALRYYRRSPLWALFLPLVAAFYAGSTLHSAVSHWRGAGGLWKGRVQGR
jgi:hopene-associated glycosyltransferase HpnB